MKVLMINSVCGIRSTGRICTDIAEVLEKSGHECKIAYGREVVPEKYKKYAVRIGSNMGVKLHAGLSRIFDSAGFHSKHATKKFIKWVKQYNPDIIHLHNLHGYYLHLGILFKYLKSINKPIVWTLHDCWPFTGHCAYFDFVRCDKWEKQCVRCIRKRDYPSSLIFDKSKRNYRKKKKLMGDLKNLQIITPSQWLANLVKRSFLKEYDVKVIPNGIDLSVFKPTESDFRIKYGLGNKRVVLGVAGVWDERKGLADFLGLSKLLTDDYKIVLVGLTRRQINSLPTNVLGIEKTNNVRELAEIYSTADVLLNPTYEDNYPTTNLEAQACGTPVITYRTGGSVESVPVENVVEKGDIERVADILKGKSSLEILCQHQNFDKNKTCNKYSAIYLGGKL